MTADDFLDDEALFLLTGFRQKRKQIGQLRRMGIAFNVNAAGKPVVADASVKGSNPAPTRTTWEPSWAANHR
jgi:hypothetical protein